MQIIGAPYEAPPPGCTEYKHKVASAKNITKYSFHPLSVYACYATNKVYKGAGSISYHVPHTWVVQSHAFLGCVSQQRPSNSFARKVKMTLQAELR